ncbi:MAG: hypothetical protein H6723_14695 [Sandaracinus sp.]|nr:hypothetical protein [Sandaracinus sp.]
MRLLLGAFVLLVGCKGHTGGMTPGRAIGRAAAAIATATAATVAHAATHRRDRRGSSRHSDPGDPLAPLPFEPQGTAGGEAPLRLVRMPTGDAALSPEDIVCSRADQCVAVAARDCRAVAVLHARAGEVRVTSCEPPGETYVPRCVQSLCRLESRVPNEVVRDDSDDARDDGTSDPVPTPPPGYD